MKEKYNSYREFSNDFFDEHPELFDRVGVKVKFKLEIDTHSDITEEEIRGMVIQAVLNGEGSYAFEATY